MSLSSAYYPGETIIFPNEMGIENLVYTIIGNSSPVVPLGVDINLTNIIITFPQDMIPDNFDIVFLENQTKEIVQIIYRSSGGSSKTKYIDRNVTTYVPIHNNTIEEIIVEKIVNNETILETGYELWHILLFNLICLLFGGLIVYMHRSN